ncbi:MAG: VOC family protein [Chthonomonadales bacterium]
MEFKFDHAAQVVPEIAEAVDWYKQVIGEVTVLFQDTTWAFIDAGGARLAFVVKDQHPNHLAWRVSGAKLEEMAVSYNKEIKTHRDKTRSFYLESPGGGAVEIISVEGSPWEELNAL